MNSSHIISVHFIKKLLQLDMIENYLKVKE